GLADTIYDATRFAGVTLSEETWRLRALSKQLGERMPPEQLDPETLVRLNRLLLEDAYPAQIIKSRVYATFLAGCAGREVNFVIAKDEGGGMSLGGFKAGELIAGLPFGRIIRTSQDDRRHSCPPDWVVLPMEPNTTASFHVAGVWLDRTGIFGG